MSVESAAARDIELLGPKAAESTLAATALALARELDDRHSEEECEECGHVQSWTMGRNSATSKSMCAKALNETMSELRALAPPKQEEDEVELARKRRADRLARKPAPGTTAPS